MNEVKRPRTVNLNQEFDLFGPETKGDKKEGYEDTIILESREVPPVAIRISVGPIGSNNVRNKSEYITPFDLSAGAYIDAKDFNVDSRIQKMKEIKEADELLNIERVPHSLLVSMDDGSEINSGLFEDQEEGNTGFSYDVWDFLNYKLRIVISCPEMTVVSSESEEEQDDSFHFLHFQPVDANDVAPSNKEFRRGIAQGVYLWKGWELGLPDKLEELQQMRGRFVSVS